MGSSWQDGAERDTIAHREMAEVTPSQPRYPDVLTATKTLVAVHKHHVTSGFTADRVKKILGVKKEVMEQMVRLTRVGGDWMPQYTNCEHQATVAEAWEGFRAAVARMVKDGEIEPDSGIADEER